LLYEVQYETTFYLTDPLQCDCGGTLRVVAFITQPKVIRKILDQLKKTNSSTRAPPDTPAQPAFAFP
jgi:hypothetical protein